MTPRGSPMRTLRWAVATIVVAAAGAEALEVDIAYETRRDREFFPYGAQHAAVSLDAPEGEWSFPDWVSDEPLYVTFILCDEIRLVVLDKKKKDDPFYTRMYFDANGNRNLDDDPVYIGKYHSDRNMHQTEFNPVKTTVVIDGVELPYEFDARTYCWLSDSDEPVTHPRNRMNIQFHTMVRCAYRGSFDLGGNTYNLWLADGNGNGRFSDTISLPDVHDGRLYGSGDAVFLTEEKEKTTYDHQQYLPDHLVLGGKVYKVDVSTAKGKVTLTPVSENLAHLAWPDQLVALEVYDPETEKTVMLFREGKQAPVPEGKYQILNYRLVKKDKQGDTWQLRAVGTADCPVVDARAGKVARFPLGEPFSPKVVVPEYTRHNLANGAKQVQLELGVYGRVGEFVGDLRHIDGHRTKVKLSSKDGSRPAEPVYRIITGEGEMVASGTFEYG